MKASLFALFLVPAAVGACVAEGTGGAGSDLCGASGLQDLVGEPKAVLQTMRFSQPLRVIGFGMPITMDYNPTRLNIDIGEDGLISRVWCG